ncbi:hypothetical protein D5R40_09870 [Okeania hirsuta]|uniref:Uncharacterized protein n=1 Tax=Okeania hirsuta TaxID=1458930 RepID=A0A3N6NLE1_9CYAN|nr:hypothetical protein D4Z78_19890 [Okeania hirsuta]RQH46192.1 hypothetical protein D5R40_09870 [Okeania hirsuta]
MLIKYQSIDRYWFEEFEELLKYQLFGGWSGKSEDFFVMTREKLRGNDERLPLVQLPVHPLLLTTPYSLP